MVVGWTYEECAKNIETLRRKTQRKDTLRGRDGWKRAAARVAGASGDTQTLLQGSRGLNETDAERLVRRRRCPVRKENNIQREEKKKT
ncbi:hypothetical protein DIPPA_22349 [Diplonema papillatum]|nr:hypothetical protein DIPPA_20315 [Diplonema papillatum]KAJ9448883.1 hypothetical protein DIPPA_22349 [Diplonema papillatum]